MQRRLRESGLDDKAAGAITREIVDAITGEVATKSDLREFRNELHTVCNELKAEVTQLRGDVARLGSRIAEPASEIAGLRNMIAENKVSSARWAIGLIATIALGFAGVIVALVVA